MKNISKKRGITQIIFFAIVIVVALAYFNVDLRGISENILQNPFIQKVWHIFVVAWAAYIKPLFTYLWTSFSELFK